MELHELIIFAIVYGGFALLQNWNKNRNERQNEKIPKWLDSAEENQGNQQKAQPKVRKLPKKEPTVIPPQREVHSQRAPSQIPSQQQDTLPTAKSLHALKKQKQASHPRKKQLSKGRYSAQDIKQAIVINTILDKPKSYKL